jgi:hypothetical protein
MSAWRSFWVDLVREQRQVNMLMGDLKKEIKEEAAQEQRNEMANEVKRQVDAATVVMEQEGKK